LACGKLTDDQATKHTTTTMQNSIVAAAHYIASKNQEKASAAMTLESTEEIKTVQQAVSYLESIQSLLKDIA
jgi:hypothetical protein